MMQKATRYFVSIALCLSLSLITTPSPTTATILIGIDLGALAGAAIVGLALKSAFTIGASLGQATRGKGRSRSSGRSYGRRRSYNHGKREAEHVFEEDKILNGIETNLISDGFNLMKNSDPNDCFKRIICDIATGEKEYSMMSPLMNFVSDNEDQFVPPGLKEFSSNLKLAKKIGEAGKNIDICQDTFKCPFTGEEMLNMTLEDFYPKFEKNLHSGLRERRNNE